MKNMKVRLKLIVSFLIVIVLTLAVGLVGIIGMSRLEQAGTAMYNEEVEPLPIIARSNQLLQRTRVSVREMIIAVVENDRAAVDSAFNDISRYVARMTEYLDAYNIRIVNDEIRQYFESGRTRFERDLVPVVLGIHEASLENDMQRISALLESCRSYSELIIADFERCLELSVQDAAASNEASSRLGNTLLIIIIVTLTVSVILALTLAIYISGLISKPLVNLNEFMKVASTTGDISLTEQDMADIEVFGSAKDEIGEAFKNTGAYVVHVAKMAKELEAISNRDLTHNVMILSENDTIGKAIKQVTEVLNGLISELHSTAGQVAVSSRQIAEGSQSLAQGSTEQAASVQQLSSSIAEVAQKTKDNASMAERAAALAREITTNAEKGSHQMNEMMEAVKDINESSQNIGKVIKSIDDIAYQTNILALNAAVEAARAGQHGKGFAVVAEEVRNLAAKSAESAKDTERLIADSIEKAQLGSRIADETAASLSEIVSGIGESSQLVGEIAKSSEEQSTGIDQINLGIDQVAQVTQQNSATAEQSAASSQEMSGQSGILREMISRFKLRDMTTLFIDEPTFVKQVNTVNAIERKAGYTSADDLFGKY